MLVDQFAEGDAHLFLDDARALDMARNLEELGALVILTPEAREPRRAAAPDRRDDRAAFDIVDGRRAAIKPRARRERRFDGKNVGSGTSQSGRVDTGWSTTLRNKKRQ